jgi:Ca2+-binding RTX toxin-like protein
VLGLDNGLLYSDLTIAQSGSDTVISIKSSSEYLAVLTGITASNLNYFDFVSTATGNQSFTGTTGNDVFIGAAGVDTVTTNIGTDIVLTSLGNDAITVDGVGNKTIDGGAGTDSLTISVSGNTSLGSYTFSTSGDYLVLTDASSNAIQYKNIETLTVGSYTYSEVLDNGFEVKKSLWNATEKVLYMYDGGGWGGIEDLSGFSASANFGVVGSTGVDYLNLNIDRSSDLTGNMTISMGDGNDSLGAAKLKNGDSIDMGAGDDSVGIMVTGSSGTPSYASLNITKLDGGAGSDTLSFGSMGSQGSTELTLTHGGATNFENITGTVGDNIIRGDAGANVLRGNRSTDTIYGGDGNDSLSGSTAWSSSRDSASNRQQAANDSGNDTNDNLYGQAGDDLLIGTIGDNILDGGTGTDTIYSGSGSDTIVLRSGDGGSTLAAADTIADFTDGSDVLGLDNGLLYSDLTIAQSGSDTVISIKSSSEYLAVLTGIDVSALSEADFTPVDIV